MHYKFSPALTALLMVASAACVNGQAYFKLSPGYGFPLAGEQLGSNGQSEFTTTLDPETGFEVPRIVTSSENIHGSYGAGPVFSGTFGYMFTRNLGVEGVISYFSGREYEAVSTNLDSRLNQIRYASRASTLTRSNGFLFSPLLKLTAGDGLIRPYLMAGPVFGKVDFSRDHKSMDVDEGVTSSTNTSRQYSGGLAKGARGVAGLEFAIKNSFSLFAEVVITGMNYYPKKSEVTRYEIDGEDRLNTLTTKQRKVNFVERVTRDTDGPIASDDEPDQQPRISIPLSSVSANIGVKLNFGY